MLDGAPSIGSSPLGSPRSSMESARSTESVSTIASSDTGRSDVRAPLVRSGRALPGEERHGSTLSRVYALRRSGSGRSSVSNLSNLSNESHVTGWRHLSDDGHVSHDGRTIDEDHVGDDGHVSDAAASENGMGLMGERPEQQIALMSQIKLSIFSNLQAAAKSFTDFANQAASMYAQLMSYINTHV